jgi:hypothetical protein
MVALEVEVVVDVWVSSVAGFEGTPAFSVVISDGVWFVLETEDVVVTGAMNVVSVGSSLVPRAGRF